MTYVHPKFRVSIYSEGMKFSEDPYNVNPKISVLVAKNNESWIDRLPEQHRQASARQSPRRSPKAFQGLSASESQPVISSSFKIKVEPLKQAEPVKIEVISTQTKPEPPPAVEIAPEQANQTQEAPPAPEVSLPPPKVHPSISQSRKTNGWYGPNSNSYSCFRINPSAPPWNRHALPPELRVKPGTVTQNIFQVRDPSSSIWKALSNSQTQRSLLGNSSLQGQGKTSSVVRRPKATEDHLKKKQFRTRILYDERKGVPMRHNGSNTVVEDILKAQNEVEGSELMGKVPKLKQIDALRPQREKVARQQAGNHFQYIYNVIFHPENLEGNRGYLGAFRTTI
jgi:hypothetical protein